MSTMKQWVFDTALDFIFEKLYKMMQTCVTLGFIELTYAKLVNVTVKCRLANGW